MSRRSKAPDVPGALWASGMVFAVGDCHLGAVWDSATAEPDAAGGDLGWTEEEEDIKKRGKEEGIQRKGKKNAVIVSDAPATTHHYPNRCVHRPFREIT